MTGQRMQIANAAVPPTRASERDLPIQKAPTDRSVSARSQSRRSHVFSSGSWRPGARATTRATLFNAALLQLRENGGGVPAALRANSRT